MTEPTEQRGPEELDLDPETVRDLEPSDKDAEHVKGGRVRDCATENCEYRPS